MTNWREHRDKILAEDPETRREYKRLGPLYEVIADVIRYRHLRGLSQDQLAQRMGKQQPAIARLESGRVWPSLQFLQELAEALDLDLSVRFEPRAEPRAELHDPQIGRPLRVITNIPEPIEAPIFGRPEGQQCQSDKTGTQEPLPTRTGPQQRPGNTESLP